MFKAGIISGLVILITGCNFFAGKQGKVAHEQAISKTLVLQVDSFAHQIRRLDSAAEGKVPDPRVLQQVFLQSRIAYKKIEWAAEYYVPNVTRFVNGPPVPEVEMDGQRVFGPQGLQVIETLLFPKYNAGSQKELIRQLRFLQADCDKYKAYFQHVELFNWQIFDAGKQEVFRVMTLGIAGFDDPLSLNSMNESAASLKSLQTALSLYTDDKDQDSADRQLTEGIAYLQKNPAFNTFNRAIFITKYGNNISKGITALQLELKLPVVKYNRMMNQEAATLFDKNAFNVNAYSATLDTATASQIALGKRLFSDPVLSGTGTRSCQSCHQPEKAFTDGLVKNSAIGGGAQISRNTPTLINAALQPAEFYDMRVGSLEDQVVTVIQSKLEMHGSIRKSAARLWQDKSYRQQFSEAYPQKNRSAIDTMEVMNAIASYIRNLTLLNSRFDDYMRGNATAMNKEEINGFNLFMGKARCASCHYMPLFNGTLPPKYLTMDAEVIGVPVSKASKLIDPDPGRFGIVPIEAYRHAFKTPTLRNISRTAPYMHNGVFLTLEEVVDFYNKGGGEGDGIKVGNQTLAAEKLNLTEKESRELVMFLGSLESR